jgi:hypothetical protein
MGRVLGQTECKIIREPIRSNQHQDDNTFLHRVYTTDDGALVDSGAHPSTAKKEILVRMKPGRNK